MGDKKITIEHPGLILKEEFLQPFGISHYKLSNVTGVPQSAISKIIHGTRSFTIDTSSRIGKALGLSLDYFLKLQVDYDVRMMTSNPTEELENVKVIELM